MASKKKTAKADSKKTKPAKKKAAAEKKAAAAEKKKAATEKKVASKKSSEKKKAPAKKKAAAKKKAPAKKKAASAGKKKKTFSDEARYLMVQEAAYYVAERHGFLGDPSDFWAEAEAQIAAEIG